MTDHPDINADRVRAEKKPCFRCDGKPRKEAPCFCVDMGATLACLVHDGCPRHDGCPWCHGTGFVEDERLGGSP